MDSYRDKISALQREIQTDQQNIARDYQGIGESVYADPPAEVKTEPVVGEIADRLEQIDANNEQIRRIEEIAARLAAIDEEIQADKRGIRELEEGLGPVYESVGMVAFRVYKENPFIDQEYVTLFSDMVNNQEEIRDVENELAEIEAGLEQKPFLERVVLKGKVLLLKSRRSSRESALPRLARRVGEQICAGDFIDTMDDAALSEAAAPCLEVKSRVKEIEERDLALREEAETLTVELESLGAEKRYARRVSEIRRENENIEHALTDLYRRLGEVYRESLDGEPAESDRKKLLASIQDAENANSDREEHIKRLQAAIEVKRLTDEIGKMEGSIKSLQERIERQQAEIETIQGKIGETEALKAEQEQLRGDEATL